MWNENAEIRSQNSEVRPKISTTFENHYLLLHSDFYILTSIFCVPQSPQRIHHRDVFRGSFSGMVRQLANPSPSKPDHRRPGGIPILCGSRLSEWKDRLLALLPQLPHFLRTPVSRLNTRGVRPV